MGDARISESTQTLVGLDDGGFSEATGALMTSTDLLSSPRLQTSADTSGFGTRLRIADFVLEQNH